MYCTNVHCKLQCVPFITSRFYELLGLVFLSPSTPPLFLIACSRSIRGSATGGGNVDPRPIGRAFGAAGGGGGTAGELRLLAGRTGGGGGGGHPSVSRSSDNRPQELRSLDLAFMSSSVKARFSSSWDGSLGLTVLVFRSVTGMLFKLLLSLMPLMSMLLMALFLLLMMLLPKVFLTSLLLLVMLLLMLLLMLGWMKAAVDSLGRLNFSSFSCSSLEKYNYYNKSWR